MRNLVRLVLLLVVVVVAGMFLLGQWPAVFSALKPGSSTSTAIPGRIDTDRARERGAELGQKAAVATKKIEETLGEAALTSKIKAKMALDDSVKARAIDVSTSGSTVTLTGQVPSAAAHDRALALARETDGVTQVIDHVEVVTPR
jgi:osmotically-inducible protein OsmY